MSKYQHIKVPSEGEKITVNADMSLNVPDQPVIPFIEGNGTGFDITPVMLKVVDAAVAKAYAGKKNPPRSMAPMCGCPKKRCKPFVNTWCL